MHAEDRESVQYAARECTADYVILPIPGKLTTLQQSQDLKAALDCFAHAQALQWWWISSTAALHSRRTRRGGACWRTPRRNNFLLFDGRLGHGVLDTLSGDLRMTLLVNWWHHKPLVRNNGQLWAILKAACIRMRDHLYLLVQSC